jgi:hypothetical protein
MPRATLIEVVLRPVRFNNANRPPLAGRPSPLANRGGCQRADLRAALFIPPQRPQCGD